MLVKLADNRYLDTTENVLFIPREWEPGNYGIEITSADLLGSAHYRVTENLEDQDSAQEALDAFMAEHGYEEPA